MLQNARRVTCSIFHTDNLRLLGASVQNMSPWQPLAYNSIYLYNLPLLPSTFLSLVGDEV